MQTTESASPFHKSTISGLLCAEIYVKTQFGLLFLIT